MISRLLQLGLVTLALVGLVLVRQTGQERSAVRSEFERLARLTGDLTLTDPQKMHVLALETGEALHFAWRVYLPPDCRLTVKHDGGSSMSSYSEPQHIIARVRFREDPKGRLQVYTRFAGGSSQSGFGNEFLAGFLRGRWDQIRVEQLGAGETAIVDFDEEVTLLHLSLPEALVVEASQQVDLQRQPVKFPQLFQMQLLVKQRP